MSTSPHPVALTLGISPTKRGFGWVAFDGPLSLFDWGSVFVRGEKNLNCVRYFEGLLDRLPVELLVMEEPSAKVHRSDRVSALQGLLRSSALLRNVEVATYRRDQVQRCFSVVAAQSQQEIAEAIARLFPDLAHKVPRKRSAWMGEDRRMAIFSAVALVLTHFQIDGTDFVESMKPAA